MYVPINRNTNTVKFVSISFDMTISFGRNPVSGGIPASDRSAIAIIMATIGFILNILNIDLMVFELIRFMIRKIGATMIEYIMKYVIQNIDLLIDSIDTIHPICPIDE